MPTSSRVPSSPATPGGFEQLTKGSAFLSRAAGGSLLKQVTSRRLKRWGIRLIVAIALLIVAWELFTVAVGIATSDMWFNSVHAGSVYTTMIGAQILLFSVFGIIAAVIGGVATAALRRVRPPLPLSPDNDTFRWAYRKYEPRFGRLVIALGAIVPGIMVGRAAASGWQTYVLWRHVKLWHTSDPLFHKDIAFYIDVYPFHLMVVQLLLQAVKYALWIVLIGGYWYGLWRLRGGRKKITRGYTQLGALLLAAYLVVQAGNYWLSRYALTTSTRGPVTGASYTDTTAALPSRYALMGVALVGAVALVISVFRRSRVRVPGLVLSSIVVASLVIGTGWPALVFHFREAPSAATVDLGEITENEQATRAAFGLDGDVTTVAYKAPTITSAADLVSLAGITAQIPVVDPNQLSPTFNVLQQQQPYYGFKPTLDIGNYDIDGKSQDVALAVRELNPSGIPQPTWVNTHLVYTHGYGIVAAPTTEVDPNTESPVFLDGGLPPGQQIPVTRPQVYFGQGFGPGSYAIVGRPAGSHRNLEFDHPAGNGSYTAARTTYTGDGGIPVGSLARRLLFAVALHDPNVLFSSELNSASQLLEVRNPRARVAKIAPWLTLDGNVYPAVVDGQIKWIVDGYTTSANYPYSKLTNLHAATSTTLTANGASVIQPNQNVNYMQNSVKAVVDAYTGRVTLYEWNQSQHPDPLLHSWESVFPGLVKPQSSIPADLLAKLRYPSDLFNVQRTLLAKYHVTGAANFYSGNDFWTVPTDPTTAATNTINSGSGSGSNAPLASRYMSASADGYGAPRYSLSSPMVTLNGHDLAAFVSVDAQPGPGYGKFTVLDFPSSSGGESPAQVQNDIESNTKITEQLTLQRGGNSKVVLGSLESIPVAGQLLYVEPVYTQSSGGASFPILRHVIALYGDGQPSFDDTLALAVKDAITSTAKSP